MFELNYAITANDLKAVNKKIMLVYFCRYCVVAVFGIAVGIAAIVLRPDTSVFVLGIIITAVSAILLAVSLLMLIAPKNYVTSLTPTSDNALNVVVDKHGVTVDGKNALSFADMRKIKKYKNFFTVTAADGAIFIVKNAIASGQSFDELYSYMSENSGKLLLVPTERSESDARTENSDVAEPSGDNTDGLSE